MEGKEEISERGIPYAPGSAANSLMSDEINEYVA